MGWGYYPEYVPVAKRKADAAAALAKLRKQNPALSPVILAGTKLSTTWWGISWNKNLERYADYAYRIGRGRAYARNGMVLDLQIDVGCVTALVAGSQAKPYQVSIQIDKLPNEKWEAIVRTCANQISGLSELLEGKFPEVLREVFFAPDAGLFPTPEEIHLRCSCPDWANMCKHVAAALYGVGARLDHDPLLFFTLRGIQFESLLKKSAEEKVEDLLRNAGQKTSRTLDDADIADIFGI